MGAQSNCAEVSVRWRANNRRKPAPAVAGNGLPKGDALGSGIDNITELKAQPGRLRDRFGHYYPDRVLDNWSLKACVAMGLRRVAGGDR